MNLLVTPIPDGRAFHFFDDAEGVAQNKMAIVNEFSFVIEDVPEELLSQDSASIIAYIDEVLAGA